MRRRAFDRRHSTMESRMPEAMSTSRPQASDAELRNFRIDAPVEIAAYLRDLLQQGALITLTAPGGRSVNTLLWTVDLDAQQISFDASSDAAQDPDFLAGDELSAVAFLDKVKLEFELEGLTLVIGETGVALRAKLPDVLYRFQRREAFRVKPIAGAVPQVHLLHPRTLANVSLRVLDISIGGLALQLPPDMPAIDAGTLLHGVELELGRDNRFDLSLRVKHVAALHPRSLGLQLGCAFGELPREALLNLQLFIDHTQKRHRLLQKR